METKTFNDIKEMYGKDASWAIWDSAGEHKGYERHKHLDNYEEIKNKLKPNIVLVGLNQALEMPIKETFSNFHLFENDIVTKEKGFRNEVGLVMDPMTPINTYNLVYAIKGTEYEGAYMTDIIKHKTVKDKVRDLANANNIMDYLKNHPEIIEENIKIFKEELKLIGSENPLIIALGSNTHWILSKYFVCIKGPHYSHFKYNRNPEDYRTDFWNAVKNGGTFTAHRESKVARHAHSPNEARHESQSGTSPVPLDIYWPGRKNSGFRKVWHDIEKKAFEAVQYVLSEEFGVNSGFTVTPYTQPETKNYIKICLDEKPLCFINNVLTGESLISIERQHHDIPTTTIISPSDIYEIKEWLKKAMLIDWGIKN